MDDVAEPWVHLSCIIYAFRIGCCCMSFTSPCTRVWRIRFSWVLSGRVLGTTGHGRTWLACSASSGTTRAGRMLDSKLSSISSPPPRLPAPLGLRACPLQCASSAVIRPPIRLPHHSSTARIHPMIVCAVRRLFRLIVALRLPQRIEQR